MAKLRIFSIFLLILAHNSLAKKPAPPQKLAISLARNYFRAIQSLNIKHVVKTVEFPIKYFHGKTCAELYPEIAKNWTMSPENIRKNLGQLKTMNGPEFRPEFVDNARWIVENGTRILQWNSAKHEMHKNRENIMIAQFHAKKFNGKLKIFRFGSVC